MRLKCDTDSVVHNNKKGSAIPLGFYVAGMKFILFNTFLFNKYLCEAPEASTVNKTDKIAAFLELMF